MIHYDYSHIREEEPRLVEVVRLTQGHTANPQGEQGSSPDQLVPPCTATQRKELPAGSGAEGTDGHLPTLFHGHNLEGPGK